MGEAESEHEAMTKAWEHIVKTATRIVGNMPDPEFPRTRGEEIACVVDALEEELAELRTRVARLEGGAS